MSDELVTVKIFSNEIEASMAGQMLEQSGVKCFVSSDDAGGMEPQLQMTMGVRLVVSRADAERSLEILKTLDI